MSFVTLWLAFAGIGAMTIPIIIHLLFRRRRRPIMWGAMQLLLEAVRRHRRRARVEQILLLAVRCLILLLIGLALAEPLLSGIRALGSGSRVVVFVVDDGLVSGIQDDTGRAELESTVETAVSLLDELDPGDRVAVVRASYPVREITDGPTVDLERVRRFLNDLKPEAGSTDLPTAMQLADRILDEHAAESPATVVLLGSWRRGSFSGADLTQTVLGQSDQDALEDSSGRVRELLATSPSSLPRSVIAVESVKMRRPVASTRVDQPPVRTTVAVRRMGNDLSEAKSVVRLSGAGIEETLPRQIDFSAGASKAVIEFTGRLDPTNATADGTSAVVALVDDQAIADVARRAAIVDTSPTIQVGIIDRNEFSTSVLLEDVRSSDWIRRALEPDLDGIIEVDQIDPASLSERTVRGLDALVVSRPDLLAPPQWEVIENFVQAGRFVLILPPADRDVHSWLDSMGARFKLDWQVDLETREFEVPVGLTSAQASDSLLSMLASEIDVLATPVRVDKSLAIAAPPGDATTILQTTNGDPVLVTWKPSGNHRGTLALLTIAPHLSWSSLPVKPLMVPLMQELIREGTSAGQNATAVTAGEYANVPISGTREITGPGGVSVPVERSGASTSPLRRTGHWIARDTTGAPLSTIVVNADIEAADPTLVSNDALEDWLGAKSGWEILENDALVSRFAETQANPIFSLILLMIALLLLVLETALNRWFARARVSQADVVPSGGVT